MSVLEPNDTGWRLTDDRRLTAAGIVGRLSDPLAVALYVALCAVATVAVAVGALWVADAVGGSAGVVIFATVGVLAVGAVPTVVKALVRRLHVPERG